MGELVFASSNQHKFDEAREILASSGVGLRFRHCDIDELQTTDVARLIHQKCLDAYARIARPLIVEHTTLHSVTYGGFPAGLTSVFLKTVGLAGATDLLGRPGKNRATATTTVAFTDGKTITTFEGSMDGEILGTPAITDTDWKKFGWNAIFKPDGFSASLAEIGATQKNTFSMRKVALERLVAGGILSP